MGTGAEEIRQQMGLDAQAVLNELQRVETAFNSFGVQLTGMGTKFDSFNQSAAKTISTLQQMATEATNAFNALAKVGQAPAAGGGAGGGGGGGGGTGGGAVGADARNAARIMAEMRTPQEQYAARMTQLNNLAQKGAIDQQTFGRAVAKAGDDLTAATNPLKNITITWETMARVVVTQFIVRALSQLRDAFSEAYQSALAFSKQIGEIHAIDPSRTFAETAAEVRALSNAFNQPLSTVAEAQYQTISDQFVTLTERTNILTAANALAKVSAQSLSSAATLLTGALNAYGESSEMAGLRAAQFDKTIELGRLRMEELGTALGRTQTLAHSLGISMEELEAGLIAITIGGVKANEAATQLRSMMAAFEKPSDGMKAALKEIGVDSGEAAIAAWGLVGAFQQVAATTDGSTTALAKLVPNIRALPGVLRLLNEGAKKYEEGLKALAAVDMETLNKKLKDFVSTDAERLTAELNKISNFFKVEFGAELVKSIRQVLDVFGGGDGLVPILRALTGSLPALGIGLAAVVGSLVAVRVAAALARAELTGLRAGFLGLVGIPLAQAAGKALGELWRQNITAEMRAVQEQTAATERMNQEKATAITHTATVAQNDILKILRQANAEANKEYLADVDNYTAAVKIKEKTVEQSYDRIMQARKKLTNDLFAIEDNAYKKMEENNRKIVDLMAEREDRHFQSGTHGASDESQMAMVADRIRTLSAEAARLQASAIDPNQEKAADAAWKRVDALEKQEQALAKQVGTSSALAQADRVLDDVDAQRRYSLSAQYMLQRQIAQEAEARARLAEEHNNQLELERQAIDAKLKDALRSKSSDEMRQKLDEAAAMTEEFVKHLKEFGSDFSKAFLNDPRAFTELQRQGEKLLSGMDVKNIQVAPEAIMAMRDQLQAGLNKMGLYAPVVARMEQVTGMEAGSVGTAEVTKQFQSIWATATARDATAQRVAENLKAAAAEYSAAEAVVENLLRHPKGDSHSQAQIDAGINIRGRVVEMRQLADATKITDEAAAHLDERMRSLSPEINAFFPHKLFDRPQKTEMVEGLETMLQALVKLGRAQREAEANMAPAGEPSKKELDAIGDQIKEIDKKKAAEAAAAATVDDEVTAAGEATRAIDSQVPATQRATQAAGALEAAWRGVAAQAGAAAQAAGAAGAPGSQTIQNPYYQPSMDMTGFEDYAFSGGGLLQRLAMGGLTRYFDRGNFAARGTDVIPAMLSPGEFVMSARATRQFYSQLVAMNAGVTPSYRAQGGGTRVTVGDIHVNGAAEPSQTAREVIKSLKRELRRGTSAF